MEKGDLDYQIMEYLDAPVRNIILILQRRSNLLRNLNTTESDFKRIGKDFQVFSSNYFGLLRIYSKFGILDENIREKHGKSVIERFKKILGEINKPYEELEELITQKSNLERIQELGQKLYGYSSNLGACASEFITPMYQEYRRLKYSK